MASYTGTRPLPMAQEILADAGSQSMVQAFMRDALGRGQEAVFAGIRFVVNPLCPPGFAAVFVNQECVGVIDARYEPLSNPQRDEERRG